MVACALFGQLVLGVQLFHCNLDQDCPDETGYCPACVFVHRAGPLPAIAPPEPSATAYAVVFALAVAQPPSIRGVTSSFQSRAPPISSPA